MSTDSVVFGEVMEFPEWLREQLNVSQRQEAPLVKRRSILSSALNLFAKKPIGVSSCVFYMHVHGIEGLPETWNSAYVLVSLRRKDKNINTKAVAVQKGFAEIEQTLKIKCRLYRGYGSTPSSPKYTPKACTLFSLVQGLRQIEIGRHEIDLARILPSDLSRDHVPWTTNFELKGKANGATLIVTFGYEVEIEKGVKISALVNQRTYATYSEANSVISTPAVESPKAQQNVEQNSDIHVLEAAANELNSNPDKIAKVLSRESESDGEDEVPWEVASEDEAEYHDAPSFLSSDVKPSTSSAVPEEELTSKDQEIPHVQEIVEESHAHDKQEEGIVKDGHLESLVVHEEKLSHVQEPGKEESGGEIIVKEIQLEESPKIDEQKEELPALPEVV